MGHDYKYGELLKTGGVWRGAALNPRSECLKKVAVAFIENVFRTDDFVSLPAELVARCKTGRSSDHDRMTVGVNYITELLNKGDIGVTRSIDASLSSVIIESWTMFETLAQDLWIAAVNGGLPEFAQRVNAANHDKVDHASIEGHELKYDPRKDFAAAQVEVGKVTFSRLDKIIYWYVTTFKGEIRRLFKEVEDGYIYALSAYRNALIHNAGKVDRDFIERIKPVDDLRGKFNHDEKLQLDGELARKLCNSAIVLGQRLILFIDDLITPMPKPSGAGDDS